MGVPRLKKKAELNYRRGLIWKSCSYCDHFVRPWAGTGEGRCRRIGLEPGRQYRILPHYLCDAYDDTKTMEWLKKEGLA